jgi:hypothetical protein
MNYFHLSQHFFIVEFTVFIITTVSIVLNITVTFTVQLWFFRRVNWRFCLKFSFTRTTLERLTSRQNCQNTLSKYNGSINPSQTSPPPPPPCVDRSRSLTKQTYCVRSANDTWVSSSNVSWNGITGICRVLLSFCYYLPSIPCKICQFVTYIPPWYNSLLLDFIVSAKGGERIRLQLQKQQLSGSMYIFFRFL